LSKRRTLAQLREIVRAEKSTGRKIVLANGCFDLIHIGHVRYLQAARSHGDRLIVAINSDDSVRRLKGPGRPLLTESERSEIVSAFECVDDVIIFSEPDVAVILRALEPHIHVKGSDYTEETVPEKDIVRSYGGRVLIAGGPKVRSTSDIIRRLSKSERHA
jgi:D-glycero-beta-D-manno-heptose 1-phosphate adenylyltransferase